MLQLEKIRVQRRRAGKRIRRSGDRVRGELLMDGGSMSALSTEEVYGMTQAQAEELVSGQSTALHYHSDATGQRPMLDFIFGGEVGQEVSYRQFADLSFGVAMPRAGRIRSITAAVDTPSAGGYTDFQIYRNGTYIPSCYVRLPAGDEKECLTFLSSGYPFSECDIINVAALAVTPGMTKARDGVVVVEVAWT